jgi:FkbM family methyltransferase
MGKLLNRLRFRLSGGRYRIVWGSLRPQFLVGSAKEVGRVRHLSGERALLKQLLAETRQGDVVYDVGANIGTHTMLFAMTVGEAGHVVSFEPEPATAQRLRNNVALNNLGNVQFYALALGERSGDASLEVDSRAGSGSHSMYRPGLGKAVTVRVAMGDALVQAEGLPIPNIVKVDVEGGEYQVLAGLRQTLGSAQCRLLCCEVHPSLLEQAGNSVEQLETMVREVGFTSLDRLVRGNEWHLIARKASGMEGR